MASTAIRAQILKKRNTMNKLLKNFGMIVLGGLILSTACLSSCRKKGDTVARVKVLDTASIPFSGAMVRLYPTPTLTSHGAIVIDDTSWTEIDGVAIFDYTDDFNLGAAGFAVLDIEVRSGDTLYGEGIIKIVEEETSEAVVIIQ